MTPGIDGDRVGEVRACVSSAGVYGRVDREVATKRSARGVEAVNQAPGVFGFECVKIDVASGSRIAAVHREPGAILDSDRKREGCSNRRRGRGSGDIKGENASGFGKAGVEGIQPARIRRNSQLPEAIALERRVGGPVGSEGGELFVGHGEAGGDEALVGAFEDSV